MQASKRCILSAYRSENDRFGLKPACNRMNDPKPVAKQKRDAELCAGYLKALGDITRLQIIKALQTSPLTVTDLSLLLDSEMANVSHHLRVLFHAGLVSTERDGKFIYYRINREVVKNKTISKALDFGCCKLEMLGQS
jgi:DNA-binding transcriptional ArsR family regulator